MKKVQKFLIESGVLLTAISMKAKKTGKSVKEYLYEEETIKHISLVLYDLLPLSVKIGVRYPKFHEVFERNFKSIRNALLGAEEMKEEVVIPTLIKEELVLESQPLKKKRKVAVRKSTPTKTITKTKTPKVKKNEE